MNTSVLTAETGALAGDRWRFWVVVFLAPLLSFGVDLQVYLVLKVSEWSLLFLATASRMLLLVWAAWFASYSGRPREYLGLHWPGWKQMAAWGGGWTVFLISVNLIGWALGIELRSPFQWTPMQQGAVPWPVWAALGLCGAPICEEVYFRGALFGSARLFQVRAVPAIVGIALIFASGHFYQGWPPTVSIFIAGVVWGLARMRTGSIWPCVLMHSLTNTLYLGAYAAQMDPGTLLLIQ